MAVATVGTLLLLEAVMSLILSVQVDLSVSSVPSVPSIRPATYSLVLVKAFGTIGPTIVPVDIDEVW